MSANNFGAAQHSLDAKPCRVFERISRAENKSVAFFQISNAVYKYSYSVRSELWQGPRFHGLGT